MNVIRKIVGMLQKCDSDKCGSIEELRKEFDSRIQKIESKQYESVKCCLECPEVFKNGVESCPAWRELTKN